MSYNKTRSTFKKPRRKVKVARDEENILSKDIDIEAEMNEYEKMNEFLVPTKDNLLNIPRSFVKTLKFRPTKYKGSFLPFHLRWIFNSSKTNELVLIQEIEALESEINRLKQTKTLNREFRAKAGFPIGLKPKTCNCCGKINLRNHNCDHISCDDNCDKKILDKPFSSPSVVNKNRFGLGKPQEYVSDRQKNEINELTSNKQLFKVSAAEE